MGLPAHKPSIDTCNACGKLFPRTSVRLCAQCSIVEENRFELVRGYLIDNDGAPLGEVARETGVSMGDVRRFADGGRLIEITSGMNHCTCGGVGDRCRFCRAQLSNSFREMEATMRREQADPPARDRPSSGDGRTRYVRRRRRLGDAD